MGGVITHITVDNNKGRLHRLELRQLLEQALDLRHAGAIDRPLLVVLQDVLEYGNLGGDVRRGGRCRPRGAAGRHGVEGKEATERIKRQ